MIRVFGSLFVMAAVTFGFISVPDAEFYNHPEWVIGMEELTWLNLGSRPSIT